MTSWFTADYHLGHANIITYCNRPFKDVFEMDETILDNLSSSIKPGDTLYYLGDISFHPDLVYKFLNRLHDVKVYFILGNHDKNVHGRLVASKIPAVSLMDIAIDGQKITLCHYAMRVWNDSHFNAWQLYGHSHGTLPPVGKQRDVGVDTNDFKPVSFDQLVSIMLKQPDNPNYIPPGQRLC